MCSSFSRLSRFNTTSSSAMLFSIMRSLPFELFFSNSSRSCDIRIPMYFIVLSMFPPSRSQKIFRACQVASALPMLWPLQLFNSIFKCLCGLSMIVHVKLITSNLHHCVGYIKPVVFCICMVNTH